MLNSLKFMTHTRMRSKIASTNKAEDKKIQLWGPYRTPLGMLKVNRPLSNWNVRTSKIKKSQVVTILAVVDHDEACNEWRGHLHGLAPGKHSSKAVPI